MKAIIFVLLLCPLIAFSQIDGKQLPGSWVLSYVEAKGNIRISRTTSQSQAATSASVPGKTDYVDVPLQTYVDKDMKVGITSFVFTDRAFEFYRAKPITFSGTYTLDHGTLVLQYGIDKNEKRSKITSLSADKLVMVSESHGKPITLFFVRK